MKVNKNCSNDFLRCRKMCCRHYPVLLDVIENYWSRLWQKQQGKQSEKTIILLPQNILQALTKQINSLPFLNIFECAHETVTISCWHGRDVHNVDAVAGHQPHPRRRGRPFSSPWPLPETKRSLKARKVRSCCTSILLYPAAYPVVSMTDKTPPQPSNLLGQPTQSTQYNWYGGIQRPSKWLLNNVMASTSSATEVQLLEIWNLEAQQRQQRKRMEEDGRGKESPCCQDVPRCTKSPQSRAMPWLWAVEGHLWKGEKMRKECLCCAWSILIAGSNTTWNNFMVPYRCS